MDGSPPGSSVREILQARILEWAALPSSKGSSQGWNPRLLHWRAGSLCPAPPGMRLTPQLGALTLAASVREGDSSEEASKGCQQTVSLRLPSLFLNTFKIGVYLLYSAVSYRSIFF